MKNPLFETGRAVAIAFLLAAPLFAESENRVVLDVPSTPEHPRNSEGSFIALKSGRIEFYYTQFDGGSHDESPAGIAEVHSDDQGRTWTAPHTIITRGDNNNIMDVSLLRLASGKLALFYGVKKTAWLDCRPVVRLSTDEGATWSDPTPVVVAPGYTGTNNDRVIQTHTGRIIMPVPYNRIIGTANSEHSIDWHAITCWYLSDDEGTTWREAPQWWTLPVPSRVGMDEPGVVELADGSLYSWARTDTGKQWACRSTDNGEHWSPPEPTELISPNSPNSVKRLPHSSTLLAVFNDHSGRFPMRADKPGTHGRTPLVAALSFDGGHTWPARKLLESDPDGNFAYTAIHFTDDAVLLGYSMAKVKGAHLGQLRIRRIEFGWLPKQP